MANFCFKTYDENGKSFLSYIEAISIKDAKDKLYDLQISYSSIKQKKFNFQNKVSSQNILEFTYELSQLINANIPIYESLELLYTQHKKEKISLVIHSLMEQIKSGHSLSEALNLYPQYFDELYCNLIEVGEISGHLGRTLNQIHSKKSKEQKIKRKVKDALIYPSVLLLFCFALINLMIFYIVPSLEDLIEINKAHALTQIVFKVAKHLKAFEIFYILGFIALFIALKKGVSKEKFQAVIHKVLFKFKISKSLLIDFNLTHFTSIISLLLNEGINLSDAIDISQKMSKNSEFKKETTFLNQSLSSGYTLSEQMQKCFFFPPLFIHMIRVAEKTGEIKEAFLNLTTIYQENLELKIKKMTQLLSPVILILMGVIIGALILGILIPLTDINSIAI